jgi:diguanylate cyclase (GGDEF)-like protein/PAS domain S-box-containing protein
VRRDERVLSAGLRTADGRLMMEAGQHRLLWRRDAEGNSSTQVTVPLFKQGERWGSVEVRFETIRTQSLLTGLWERPVVRLTLVVACAGFVIYLLYMRRTLRYLDPSAVIPARVQTALDVMMEGVMLVDEQERVVLVNAALAQQLGRSPSSLMGMNASTLGWKLPEGADPGQAPPWIEAIREARTSTNVSMRLQTDEGERIFGVNGSPVLDGWGNPTGAIATFDDLTELEEKTRELERTLVLLEKSQYEIRLQNEQLQVEASHDPLTGIANRRAFMEAVELAFEVAQEADRNCCCIMVDIDHFKKVNDTYGHATGDDVIRRVAEALGTQVKPGDCVSRYGGEEFCIVLPDVNITAATQIAERIRKKIEAPRFASIPVTVSLGVSSIVFGATTANELIAQADEALYASKEGGRNLVTRWDRR